MASVELFRIGETAPYAMVLCFPGRAPWSAICEAIGVRDDQAIDADVYWGGPDGDEDSAEVVVIDGKIVASIDRAITAEDVAAILASPNNEHAKLRQGEDA